jgi:hypothetical protein
VACGGDEWRVVGDEWRVVAMSGVVNNDIIGRDSRDMTRHYMTRRDHVR